MQGYKKCQFFWGENLGDFIHWDSASPNSRQAPTYSQTCSRLPIDPVSSILDPRPVPLIILLFCACPAQRNGGARQLNQLKPCKPQQMNRTDTACPSHPVPGPGSPVIGCSPHICLNVYMFECLYVHMFLRELQILDIRHWMANTSRHQDTENQK